MKSKIKRSDEIRRQIADFTTRAEDLRPQLNQYEAELKKANADFLETADLEPVRAADQRLSLVRNAVDTLAKNITRLSTELQTVLAVEGYEDLINGMKANLVTDRTAHAKSVETRKAVSDAIDAMLEAKDAYEKPRLEFADAFKKIMPEIERWPIISKYHQAKWDVVSAGLEEAGISKDDLDFMLGRPVFPVTGHEATIDAAQNYKAEQRRAAKQLERQQSVDKANELNTALMDEALKKRSEENALKAYKQQRGLEWRPRP